MNPKILNGAVLLMFLRELVEHPLRVLTSPLNYLRAGALAYARPVGGGSEILPYPLGNNIYEEQYMNPESIAGTAKNGGTIDLEAAPYKEFDNFRFILLLGATAGVVDFEVQDSADGSSWATLTDADGADLDVTQMTATDDNKFVVIEITTRAYVVRRRIRATVTPASAATLIAVYLQGYNHAGDTPTPAAADRLELKVGKSAT